MKIKRVHILLILLVICAAALPFRETLRRHMAPVGHFLTGKKTVGDRVAQFGDIVRERLGPYFEEAGVSYPPEKIILAGLKDERLLQVWVAGPKGEWRHLKDYPIIGMSGGLGPKFREWDGQVPEGLYQVESLNPNSLYHLAIRINYPNAADRERGRRDGRENLGSDIMIHGSDCSIGCLAMGDEAAEDLFVLVAGTGGDNVSIILSPVDFRVRDLPENMPPTPEWTTQLYAEIRRELGELK